MGRRRAEGWCQDAAVSRLQAARRTAAQPTSRGGGAGRDRAGAKPGLARRIALLRHDFDAARVRLDEALEIATKTRNRLGLALVLAVSAQVAWVIGDAERATTIHAGATLIQYATGYAYAAPRAREIEREQADIRTSLGRTAYEAASAQGESMNWNELIEYARKTLAPGSPAARR